MLVPDAEQQGGVVSAATGATSEHLLPMPSPPIAGPPPAPDMQVPSLVWSLLDQPLPVEYVCKELVDPARVELVLRSKGLRQQRDEWLATKPEDRRQGMDPLLSLKKYQQVAEANGGTVAVQYTNTARGYGRVTGRGVGSEGGFICSASNGMMRATRAALFAENYHDVDVVNAAPTILAQALLAAGIECPLLCSYVSHRDEWLQLLVESCHVTRDEAKDLLRSLVHNGSHGR